MFMKKKVGHLLVYPKKNEKWNVKKKQKLAKSRPDTLGRLPHNMCSGGGGPILDIFF